MARTNLTPDETSEPVKPASADLTPYPSSSVLKIDEVRLLRVTRLMEKERAAKFEQMATLNALNPLVQELIAKDPKARELNDRIRVLGEEAQKANREYQAIALEIGRDLKINMQEYAFDDETGVLHKLPPQVGAPKP